MNARTFEGLLLLGCGALLFMFYVPAKVMLAQMMGLAPQQVAFATLGLLFTVVAGGFLLVRSYSDRIHS
jgi:positive regulator of sigma E activity